MSVISVEVKLSPKDIKDLETKAYDAVTDEDIVLGGKLVFAEITTDPDTKFLCRIYCHHEGQDPTTCLAFDPNYGLSQTASLPECNGRLSEQILEKFSRRLEPLTPVVCGQAAKITP